MGDVAIMIPEYAQNDPNVDLNAQLCWLFKSLEFEVLSLAQDLKLAKHPGDE